MKLARVACAGAIHAAQPQQLADGRAGVRLTDGRIDLARATARHLRQHFLGRRIHGLEVAAARQRLAVDEVVDLHCE